MEPQDGHHWVDGGTEKEMKEKKRKKKRKKKERKEKN